MKTNFLSIKKLQIAANYANFTNKNDFYKLIFSVFTILPSAFT